jgi:hypothetical protein
MLLTARELAARYRVKLSSVYDPRFRKRVGLQARKLGKKLLFAVEDIERAIKRQ